MAGWRWVFYPRGYRDGGALLSRRCLMTGVISRQAFCAWQIWVNVVVFSGYICPLYGISLFLPTNIKELGYTSTTSQLLTVLIYTVASILTVAIAFWADKIHRCSPFIMAGYVCMLIGFIMCVYRQREPGHRVCRCLHGGVCHLSHVS